MVITCPHALGLAIPLVVAVSTAKSAQNGLLIRNRTAFENARKITTVVFDKTGTLTKGSFEVTEVTSLSDGYDRDAVLALAAALELRSEHPIGKGIVNRAEKDELDIPGAQDVGAIKGKGVSGTLGGSEAAVVSPGYLAERGIELPRADAPASRAEPASSADEGSAGPSSEGGVTRVYLVSEGKAIGTIALSDAIRPESYRAIEALHERGIKCWMLTGDNEGTAKAVCGELGMDGYFAEVLPDEKQDKIKELQGRGEYVAMTGDGVNDSPALAQAQIGIAVGSGTDVAAATADIVLVNSNPLDITSLILFGRATYRKMVQNLIWATGYNVVAIPLAAGVLYGAGILLSPELGAILMSLSTVIVAINARLLRVKRDGLESSQV
jgi:Cu2+-exporting ATPase